MGYKGNSLMDCGWFIGGAEGLIYIPPGDDCEKKAMLIPWDSLLNDEDNEDNKKGDLYEQ